jgi:hypothetical protein
VEIIRTACSGKRFAKLRLFVLVSLMAGYLSGCTAIAVTSALTTATKAVVGVVKLPVKAVAGLAGSDDEEVEAEEAKAEEADSE